MKHPDKEDHEELERLRRSLSGKKINIRSEQLEPREAAALLRYIDSLEAKTKGNATNGEEIKYNQDDLNLALRKLVGTAATPPSKKDATPT